MTIEEIKKWIQKIKDIGDGDPEVAHCEEDNLYGAFIAYIANGGKKQLQEKAKLVLSTEDLDFPRWYA